MEVETEEEGRGVMEEGREGGREGERDGGGTSPAAPSIPLPSCTLSRASRATGDIPGGRP